MADSATTTLTSPAPTSTDDSDASTWAQLRDRWPLRWEDAGLLVLAYLAISAVFYGTGKLVVGPLDGSVGAFDRSTAESLASNRTATLNDVSFWASMLAETAVKIVVTALVVGVMVAVWRRWEEALLVSTALILEASIFLTVTLLVSRARPDVERLDGSPVDSSFPSGHVAAAVVYGAFAIIVARHTARTSVTWLAVMVVVAISFAVAWARTYRGMHYVSDVVAGVALGVTSLAVTWWIMRRAADREASIDDRSGRRPR